MLKLYLFYVFMMFIFLYIIVGMEDRISNGGALAVTSGQAELPD